MKINPLTSIVLFLICVVVFPLHTIAQDDPDTPDPEATEEAETYEQGCAECHIDVVLDWEGGPHAMSFSSPEFQSVWGEGGDDSCLACHTTGFVARTGEYTHEAITCEACHGATPANHPDEPFVVSDNPEMCADCHTTTFNEWEVSPHGAADLGMPCSTCHNPHPQQIRFDSNNALCLNCHETDERTDYAHVTHVEQACTDCHWHRGEFDAETHYVTGELMPSGHEGNVETVACIDCHENQDEDFVVDAENQATTLTTLVELQELQAEVESIRAQGENTSAVRLIQGIVVGLAFGGVLMFGAVRLRPGRVKERD